MNTNQESHINYFGSEINSEINLASQQLQQESRQNSIGFDNSDEDDDDEDEDDDDFDEDEDEEISRRSKAAQKKRLAQRRNKKANSQSDGEDISNLDDDGNGEDDILSGKSTIPNKELIYPPSNSYHMSEKIILLKISERDLISGSLPPNGVVQFSFTQLKCLIEAMLQINNLRKGKL